ncbi:MAG: hypothetical protein COB02_10810 [Candidatus Cloacimonadota bacterium]|nr:MAG: hypothetical protein COB02_10810 [Candidatus Cloacimonadota bacterium]
MRQYINRHIPISNKLNIFLGGFLNQFGWLFTSFGFILVWLFALNADLSFIDFQGEIIKTQGLITNIVETNISESKQSIYEYHYNFKNSQGQIFDSYSYKKRNRLSIGKNITIEYPKNKIHLSRIKGMRRQFFSPYVLFVLIFPIIGLFCLFLGIKNSLKSLKLLKMGILTKGVLIKKERTNTSINEQTVYKMIFQFKDKNNKDFFISEKTHLTHLLEDDKEERLLYLEDNPNQAIMIDTLPSSPIIDEQGNIGPVSTFYCISLLFIPTLSIIGHSGYFIFFVLN